MSVCVADRYRNDPYSATGYVALHEAPKFAVLTIADFVRADAVDPVISGRTSGSCTPPGMPGSECTTPRSSSVSVATVPHHEAQVEICIGQVPFFLDEITVASLLKWVAPEAVLRRCCIAESSMGRRRGLCFVLLKDNGAAQKLLGLHQRVWFNDDHRTVQVATNAAAMETLRQFHVQRQKMMDPTRRGDGLPLSAMTVEWSRSPRNEHVRNLPAVISPIRSPPTTPHSPATTPSQSVPPSPMAAPACAPPVPMAALRNAPPAYHSGHSPAQSSLRHSMQYC